VIYKATKQHAINLAKFVTLYKTLLLIQRRANGGKEKNADSFLAGLIGGYVVFGDRTAINEQVRHSIHTYQAHTKLLQLDRSIRVFASCSVLYPPSVPLPASQPECKCDDPDQVDPARLEGILCVRCAVVGCCDVVVQVPTRDIAAWDGQLDAVSVSGFRGLGKSQDVVVA
jgi:hypothetical protein